MTNQTDETRKTRVFTGWHMVMIIVAFFGVVIAVNGYMAYVAVASWTGLTARNGYVASQEFNTRLAVRRQQDGQGFKSVLRYQDEAMNFSFRDSSGQPLRGFEVSLKVGRPTHEGEDRQIVLKEAKPGIYRQKLKLAAGQWNVDVFAKDRSDRHYHRKVLLYVKM